MGRDKGKGRGGGGRGAGKRMQIANEEELALQELRINEEKEQRAKRRAEGDEGEEGESKLAPVDEDDEEEDSDDDAPKKPRPMKPNNPNYAKKTNVISDDPEAGLSRKQKEELEEQRKHDEYMKRHLAGETEQARKDMERLAIIKKKREEDAKKRAQEGRAAGMSAHGLPSDSDDDGSDDGSDDGKKPSSSSSSQPVKAKASSSAATAAAPVLNELQAKKKAAAMETVPASAGGEPAKLNPIDIKKMNGDALKDALRERNLDLQGQKKDLLKRLLDFEAARA